MSAKVSILIPAYNAAPTLSTALQSVQRQCHQNWECIVVDDGSTDDTYALARTMSTNDPRIRVISAPHSGLVNTLNRGIGYCTGEYVARMDADDWMHRQRISRQLEFMDTHPNVSAVGAHVRLFPRAMTEGRRNYERWLNAIGTATRLADEVFIECPIAHPTLFIRTGVLREFRYRDMGWPEDYDLVLRLHLAQCALNVIDERLLGWRDGPARLSRTAPMYAQDQFVRCKAHFLAQYIGAMQPSASASTGVKSYVLWGHGPTGRALRKALSVHGYEASHIVDVHPRRIGQTIRGALVIGPDELGKTSGSFVVCAVAGAGPRAKIRRALYRFGLAERTDFVCAA